MILKNARAQLVAGVIGQRGHIVQKGMASRFTLSGDLSSQQGTVGQLIIGTPLLEPGRELIGHLFKLTAFSGTEHIRHLGEVEQPVLQSFGTPSLHPGSRKHGINVLKLLIQEGMCKGDKKLVFRLVQTPAGMLGQRRLQPAGEGLTEGLQRVKRFDPPRK